MTKNTSKELLYRRPIGFLEARRSSKILLEYSDLLKLYYGLIHPKEREEILKRRPKLAGLEKVQLKSMLNRLSVPIYHRLLRVMAPIDWTFQKEEVSFSIHEGKDVSKVQETHVNLVLDQFMPYFIDSVNLIEAYEGLCGILEQTIALYDSISHSYWKHVINPIWWISRILRTPISVIEYMGIDTSTQYTNRLVYWFIHGLMLILLSLLCIKIGIHQPAL